MIQIPTSGTTGAKKLCLVSNDAWNARLDAFRKHFGDILNTGIQLQKMQVVESVPVLCAVDKWGVRVDNISEASLVVSIAKGKDAHSGTNLELLKTATKCKVFIAGGAALKNEDWKRMQAAIPWAKVVSQYGSTETGGICVTNGEEVKDGLVGTPYPGVEIRVVNDIVQVKTLGLASKYNTGDLLMDGEWYITEDKGELKNDKLYLWPR